MAEWISVNDRLPELNQVVLVLIEPTERAKERYDYNDEPWPRVRGEVHRNCDGDWACVHRGIDADEHYHVSIEYGAVVTHWMPYPDTAE